MNRARRMMTATRAHLTVKSANRKTGPIAVSTSDRESCPATCPLRRENGGGCYANGGPLALHWDAVSETDRGRPWAEFVDAVASLPASTMLRHNQAGDLPTVPGAPGRVSAPALGALARAAAHLRARWTYTHHAPGAGNIAAIRQAAAEGFVVNLSADTPAHAAMLRERFPDIPVVCGLPGDGTASRGTVDGVKVAVCPATRSETVSCATCGGPQGPLCARGDRDYVIGFPAHGSARRKAEKVFTNDTQGD